MIFLRKASNFNELYNVPELYTYIDYIWTKIRGVVFKYTDYFFVNFSKGTDPFCVILLNSLKKIINC